MKFLLGLAKLLTGLAAALAVLGLAAVVGAYYYFAPQLPDIEQLREVQLQVPLRVFGRDGRLLAEFGEQRRIPMPFSEMPSLMVDGFLAAEDDRFFEHPGVDWRGLVRAAWTLAATGERRQGGSTITMQVARNFFLSREKTYTRKLIEILLALKIETELSKEEILELYLNKIYLGQRAYGVAAAAQIYYGLSLEELTLPQYAMIAGLPKAPSRDNPISDPVRAEARRAYVLGRMRATGAIDARTYDDAVAKPLTAKRHAPPVVVEANYVAEMARAELLDRYGDDVYTLGLNVRTTLDVKMQDASNRALRRALMEYDRRHGWRGAEETVNLSERSEAELQALLRDLGSPGGLEPAVVTAIADKSAEILRVDGTRSAIEWSGMDWARPYRTENALGAKPKNAGDILELGDVIRITDNDDGSPVLSQLPGVQGAIVALDPHDGAIRALSGGFDFFASKFNRVTQAERQPGSSFKPFLYTAALDRNYTAATLINDAPIVIDDVSLEGSWRPQNYSRKFFGPTRLREALYRSRNLVSIRLLRDIGIEYALDYVQRFGFEPDKLPKNLSLALGSGALTPLQMATAFAVFANDGYRIAPYLIERIENASGDPIFQADPARAPDVDSGLVDGRVAERVLTPETSYIIRSILGDVVKRGTARKAASLARNDLRGKTGTTNDQVDAWFSGFNDRLVASVWVGFDQLKPLGRREVGGVAALPMWMYFFEELLPDLPEVERPRPAGLVAVRIDRKSGEPVPSGEAGGNTEIEVFRKSHSPGSVAVDGSEAPSRPARATAPAESLF